jgi:hypothetical protein
VTTPLQRAADALVTEKVGIGLAEFVQRRRATGASWRSVARDLAAATDGAIDVTDVALSNWFAHTEREDVA